MTPRLGPFELHVCFRTGAHGEIWFGRHPEQGGAVAVKVLKATWAREPRYLRAFHNEVRQVARLSLPGVIQVIDSGEVPASTEPHAPLLPGSPYLVMAHAPGGSLRDHSASLGWDEILVAVQALLRTLAAVHARGVLHRDLKPENVLVMDRANLEDGLRLSDFGLAPPVDSDAADESAAGGTPWYMAPEQIEGRLAQQGPHTDLYALGALTWELLTGMPPYAYRTARESHQAALLAPLPPLRPRVAVPPGLEGWLAGLLARDVARRPASAADALAGLHAALKDPLDVALDLPLPAPGRAGRGESTWSSPFYDDAEAPADPPMVRAAPPTRWPDDPRLPPTQLLGAGLGLAPLRRPPMVGREAARDQLWAALGRVCAGGGPEVVVLRGPRGIGKSRLGQWLQTTALEHGGVPAWILRSGVDRPLEARLARLGCPAPPGSDAQHTSKPPRERVVLALVELTRAGRPATLLLDDVLDDLDALALAELLAAPWALPLAPPPLLVIATVDDEALEAPRRAQRAAALLSAATSIPLAPLSEVEIQTALRHGPGLCEDLCRRLAPIAAGNPLIALQIASAWTRDGHLEAGPEGLRPRSAAALPVPDDLHALWAGRLAAALGDRPGALAWLVVAAALGDALTEARWEQATAAGGWGPDRAGVDALLGAGLARTADEGWILSHPLIRATIAHDAAQTGLWGPANRAAATALTGPAQASRLGHTLLQAGEPDQALDPLLVGLELELDRSDFAAAQDAHDELAAALDQASPPAQDPRRGQIRAARVRLLFGRGAYREADQEATRLAEDARRLGWKAPRVLALRYRGMAALRLGEPQQAEALLLQAEALAGRLDLPYERARARLHLGTQARLRGDAQAAEQALIAAEEDFAALGDHLGLGDVLSERANVAHTLLDEPAAAEALLSRAREHFARIGRTAGLAFCLTTLGDMQRLRGDLEAALATTREARRLYERIGSPNIVFAEINLGLICLAVGRVSAAATCFETATTRARAHTDALAFAAAGMLVVAAARQDHAAFAAQLRVLRARLDDTGLVSRDLAWCLQEAARLASAWPVAAEAAQIAEQQAQALERARSVS